MLGGLGGGHLGNNRVAMDDIDAIAETDELHGFPRQDQNSPAVLREVAKQLVDFRLGADIDAARRLFNEEDVEIGGDIAAEQNFLLIAARGRPRAQTR